MRRVWKWIAAGFVALLAFGKKAGATQPPSKPAGNVKGRAAVEATGRNLGLPDTWVLWLIWVAKGEADWSTGAHNDSPNESAKAGQAFDRYVGDGTWPCAQDRPKYAIGSGGWYGQLAPYTVKRGKQVGLPASLYCDPKAVWKDPVASTKCHLRQVRGTINGYLVKLPPAKRTFLHLRALYGLPDRINDWEAIDNAERRNGYSKTLLSAGIDPSFLDLIVPVLPEVA